MTNLFKRFFTHKSKFLLIILCLLGMVFSYSCSCRNDSTNPDTPPPTPNGNNKINFNTGEADGNTYLIRLSSTGDEKDNALIKFTNDDVNNVEIESIDSGTTGINFENADFSYTYSDGTLSLTEAGKNKLTEAGKSNAIKVSFKITTTSDKYKDETKIQTKQISIAVGKIKTIKNYKTDVVEPILLKLEDEIEPNTGIRFPMNKGTALDNGIKLVVKNQSKLIDDGATAGIREFTTELSAVLGNPHYNGGLFSKFELQGDVSQIKPVGTEITLFYNVETATFYEKSPTITTFKVIADMTWTNDDVTKKGKWQ